MNEAALARNTGDLAFQNPGRSRDEFHSPVRGAINKYVLGLRRRVREIERSEEEKKKKKAFITALTNISSLLL